MAPADEERRQLLFRCVEGRERRRMTETAWRVRSRPVSRNQFPEGEIVIKQLIHRVRSPERLRSTCSLVDNSEKGY